MTELGRKETFDVTQLRLQSCSFRNHKRNVRER